MAKLKIITLKMSQHSLCKHEYKAIDDNGRVLAKRIESAASNGLTFIGAILTKNKEHRSPNPYPYNTRLFTTLDQVTAASKLKNGRPFAIALLEEHKEAFEQMLEKRIF